MSFGRESVATFKHNSNSSSTRTDFTNTDCDQYYQNLQTNIQIYKNALKTAQELIIKYKAENQTLNMQNRQLQKDLSQSEKKIQVLEIAIKNSKHCEIIIKQTNEKIKYFQQKQKQYQKQIDYLNKKIQQLLVQVKKSQLISQKKSIEPCFNLKRSSTTSSKQRLNRDCSAQLLRNKSINKSQHSRNPLDLDIRINLQPTILSTKTTPSYSKSYAIIQKINNKFDNDLATQFQFWKTNRRVSSIQKNQFFAKQRSLSKNRASKTIWK